MLGYAEQVGEALLDIAQRVRPTRPGPTEWQGRQLHYQALAVFIQIIDHGIEHRTNITTMLNQGQQPPPDLAGWAYLEAHPDRFSLE